MLLPDKVPIRESALLVIDAQDSFKAGPRWARRNNPDFERNVAALIEAYRDAGCTHVMLELWGEDRHEQIRLFGERVLPHVR